jgi:hypothetical protein
MNKKHHFLSETDKALLSRDFNLSADVDLGELASELPDGYEIRDIVFRYDHTPPGGKRSGHKPDLTCSFKHGARHWKGYIVELSDGRKARIGSTCGERHLGQKFGIAENRFKEAHARQHDVRRLIA